jgi:NAD-dependent SIR2 family protein deacetylase
MKFDGNAMDNRKRLKSEIQNADAIVIGAGAGLSTSAGFVYSGERFEKFFSDFKTKYRFKDMYTGGFYPYKTAEEMWAYWSRYIYINRYMDAPKPVYDELFALVKEKDYFVITTNVDHCFQKAGFDKKRLFYTQGDYGLFQCATPCHKETYDNKEIVCKMLEAQGYQIRQTAVETGDGDTYDEVSGALILPDKGTLKMTVPDELVPYCPKCGKPMSMNLRSDNTFVEDEGWHKAAERYSEFLQRHQEVKTLFLELGVGFNTPGIIKYDFWRMVNERKNATYACLNFGEAYAPDEIAKKSICINDDIGAVLVHHKPSN